MRNNFQHAAPLLSDIKNIFYYLQKYVFSFQNSGALPSPSFAPAPPNDMASMNAMQSGFYQVWKIGNHKLKSTVNAEETFVVIIFCFMAHSLQLDC